MKENLLNQDVHTKSGACIGYEEPEIYQNIKNNDSTINCRPSWKMAAILDFRVANVLYRIYDPKCMCIPILALVSRPEW